MARTFCVPGVFLLGVSFLLGVIIVISLPSVHYFDVVRVSFATQADSVGTREVRWGIWGACYQENGSSDWHCEHTGLAYEVGLRSIQDPTNIKIIGAGYTRGLVMHVVALVAIFIALLLSFSQHLVVSLIASLMSFFSALVVLIAFAIDIALYARVHHESNDLDDVKPNTDFGPAFWMTLVQFVLLLLAGCTVCFGRHRERVGRGDTSSYPMLEQRPWYRRFGKN